MKTYLVRKIRIKYFRLHEDHVLFAREVFGTTSLNYSIKNALS